MMRLPEYGRGVRRVATLGLVSLAVVASTVSGGGARALAAAPRCGSVTVWGVSIPPITPYYFVKTASGWVTSYSPDGSDPFATASVSASGSSFSAHDVYNGGNTGYTAKFSGRLSAQCTIGVTTPPGRWSSNHDPAGGTFTLTPFGLRHTRKCHQTNSTPCLDVSVKVFGNKRSGLGVSSRFMADGPTRPGSKAFFIPPDSTKCASGCLNVVVTVTDSKGSPVSDALVTIHASTVTGVDGEGYLCDQFGASATPDCGGTLSRLGTNKDGQLRLLYWAPGLISDASVTFNGVTASKDNEKGTATPVSVNIRPYLIYQVTNAELSEKEAGELADWAASKGIIATLGKLLVPVSVSSLLIGPALGYWVGITKEAANAVAKLELYEAAEPIVGAADIAHLLYEVYERWGNVALFIKAFQLNTIGLGADNPFERVAEALPGTAFGDALANVATAVAPLHIGAAGLLWDYGKALAFLADHHDPAFGSQEMSLDIYEVSTCKEGELCGPGYRERSAGIQPQLYFRFDAGHSATEHSFGPYTFTVPYDPNGWTESQAGLRGLIG